MCHLIIKNLLLLTPLYNFFEIKNVIWNILLYNKFAHQKYKGVIPYDKNIIQQKQFNW